MSGDLGFGQKTCLTYSKLQHRYLVRTVSVGIGKCVWIYVNANVWRSCLGVGFRKLFAAFLNHHTPPFKVARVPQGSLKKILVFCSVL